MSEEYIVDVDHLTIRFNMASEKVDNLKEYVIKLIKHELMFQEFLALKDVNLKVGRSVGTYWNKWFWKIHSFKSMLWDFKTV